jgi:dienelactone hydrolase
MPTNLHPVARALTLVVACAVTQACAALPETVRFPSRDGATELTGYLWHPAPPGPHAAVIMMHGRSGAYSSAARGSYNAFTLSRRHVQWGEFWAARGYLALHVDSFGPRGYAGGFAARTYSARPAAVDEQTVRPLDAYGALDYLLNRDDVQPGRIAVFGWSNGAMAVLAALGKLPSGGRGFAAAAVLYPGCRAQAATAYRPYAPLLMLLAGADREVSAEVCRQLAERLRAGTDDFEYALFAGADHAYDDPAQARQASVANRTASDDTRVRVERFFERHLRADGARP